jgi:tetratricopeptide (TPR) repeat protein
VTDQKWSDRKSSRHPLIYKYLKKYQEDPNSRIFAPLAEAYRKTGLIDEAIELAREGLLVHPSFIGGKVALARALFDKRSYEEVVELLLPVTRDVPDNLVAQRLLAESNLMLSRVEEALNSYKMLLFFQPNDAETARLVWELEEQAYKKGQLKIQKGIQNASEDLFQIHDPGSSPHLPEAEFSVDQPLLQKRAEWRRKIECLQTLLQRVERYKRNDVIL